MNAKKTRLDGPAALELLDGIRHLYVAKGKHVAHFDLKQDSPEEAELLKLMLGPTGNLRAPTIRKGKTLVVGFHTDVYEKIVG